MTISTPDFEQVSLSGHRLVLKCKRDMSIAERGHLLLELEKMLRAEDPLIEVFLEPMGDLNKLRSRLRGVKLDS